MALKKTNSDVVSAIGTDPLAAFDSFKDEGSSNGTSRPQFSWLTDLSRGNPKEDFKLIVYEIFPAKSGSGLVLIGHLEGTQDWYGYFCYFNTTFGKLMKPFLRSQQALDGIAVYVLAHATNARIECGRTNDPSKGFIWTASGYVALDYPDVPDEQ